MQRKQLEKLVPDELEIKRLDDMTPEEKAELDAKRQKKVDEFDVKIDFKKNDDANQEQETVSENAESVEKKGIAKIFSKFGKKDGEAKKSKAVTYENSPHLQVLRPREQYLFFSDYIKIDSKTYTCVLGLFHSKGATDRFGYFWGLNLLPRNLPQTTKVIVFEQVSRMTDDWVSNHQTRAEKVSEANSVEQGRGGTNTTKRKAGKSNEDLDVIANELLNGAVYLHVHYRLQVISPSLAELDAAVDQIRKDYIDAFASLSVYPYLGEQKKELSSLLRANDKKLGVGFYYTSTEYAGSYNLVTHGIEDHDGEYVGTMTGDVNNSAVLFDIDYFKKNIVVADANFDDSYQERIKRSNVWGSKIAQSAIMNNHRVVHFLLSPVNMDLISPKFTSFTNYVNMSGGDLNMFELFGSQEDELQLFPRHLEKIKVMTEQISPPTDSDRTIIRGSLDEVLTQFYKDNRMWVADAQHNRDKLRIVNIPHNQVPQLSGLVMNLNQKHKALMAANIVDDEQVHAYSVLKAVFQSMLTSNGDLFNTITSPVFDTAKDKNRVIYDFASLLQRGKGIAMAQLVNVITYALSGLGAGDLAIFHGCDNIDSPEVKAYISHELDALYKRGGRTCMIYDDVATCLADIDFNQAIRADYTIMSTMAPADAGLYEKAFGIEMPGSLKTLVTSPHSTANYLHRGVDNIVFIPELYTGVKTGKDAG